MNIAASPSMATMSRSVSQISSFYSRETLVDDDFVQKHAILDSRTPSLEPLSAHYKNSVAYKAMRYKLPIVIRDLMRSLQDYEEMVIGQCGSYAHFDLIRVFWSLSTLRSEILTNEKFKMFYDNEIDTEEWNDAITRLVINDKNRWYSCPWLFAESYFNRRIWAAFRRAETLREFDYFSPQKMILARDNLTHMMSILIKVTRGMPHNPRNFRFMLKLSLWGCRNDWSFDKEPNRATVQNMIEDYDEHVIVDQSTEVYNLLIEESKTGNGPVIVDIVANNAGYELFTDLLLAQYLIKKELANKVRIHFKTIPFNGIDATVNDFHWLINYLTSHKMPELVMFGKCVKGCVINEYLELRGSNHFWTKPRGYGSMSELSPCLYTMLSLGNLIIVKGDGNYRKLLNFLNHNPTTPFVNALGNFKPTSICALRVIKSDIYCGMPQCAVEWLSEDNHQWMTLGEKAVIQLAPKLKPYVY